MTYQDVSELTALGRYMRETGTQGAWLAERVGTSPSTVSRWIQGTTCMTATDRQAVRRVLEERAEIDLFDLFVDQRERLPGR